MGASVEDTATARAHAGAHDVRRLAGSAHRNGAEQVEAARRTAVVGKGNRGFERGWTRIGKVGVDWCDRLSELAFRHGWLTARRSH